MQAKQRVGLLDVGYSNFRKLQMDFCILQIIYKIWGKYRENVGTYLGELNVGRMGDSLFHLSCFCAGLDDLLAFPIAYVVICHKYNQHYDRQ